MKKSYEEIMKIIKQDRHEEMICAIKCRWMIKKTLNPIRKIRYYLSYRRFQEHVFGMDLVINKIERLSKES